MKTLLLFLLLVTPLFASEPVCSVAGPFDADATFHNTAASVPIHFGAFKVELNLHSSSAQSALKYRLISTVAIDRISAQWHGYTESANIFFGQRDYQVVGTVIPAIIMPTGFDGQNVYMEMNGQMYFNGDGQLTLEVADRNGMASTLLAGSILCVTEFAD